VFAILALALLTRWAPWGTIPAFAHVTVAPQQSQTGASQVYKVRAHNENKVATKSLELTIPEGVTVVSVEKPAGGSYVTATAGTRITSITWQIEVAPGKYVELPFTVKNPEGAGELRWSVREVMADGKAIDWTGTKASVTKISVAAASAPSR